MPGPCAACRTTNKSSWHCRSDRRHDAPPGDAKPAGGWRAGCRVRVLFKTRRRAVDVDTGRDVFDDVNRVWLHCTVERALDHDEKSELLVVTADAFDPDDGAPVGALNRRFAVVWPSGHVVNAEGCDAVTGATEGKAYDHLVGRTLESWGPPSLARDAALDRPRWVVAKTRAGNG